MRKFACVLTIILAVMTRAAIAAERPVATGDELRANIAVARPGDVIVMRDGEWKDVFIDITNPLTVRAQTPGKVILSGQSKLRLAAPDIVVDGLVFAGGALSDKDGQVIHFNS
ncbi:MAG: poly(beta-D-mannuronate) lyase, partial [Humisphaera sp.]|nr:poly(beta-D-mannuronate) lyase [Humisphaera sp.]